MSKKIKVGITQGDSNGIGIEVILKALAPEGITELFTPVVFTSKTLWDDGIHRFLDESLDYAEGSASALKDGKINIVDISSSSEVSLPDYGNPTVESGEGAVTALYTAIDSLKKGEIDVLVTAPICKENVQGEKFNFPGHTEFLEAELGGDSKSLMILFEDDLRVALATGHMPLSEVSKVLTKERIEETVELFDKSLRMDFGIERPRIAVLSLNPHCGDGGLLGKEEDELIIPTVKELKDKGVLVFGPYASDGFFAHGDFRKFDGIVAMYHDQGLTPFKALGRGQGVNFTAGLPFVRTSPDHGTAFAIAGKGEADETSMRQAIYEAVDIFRRRKNFKAASSNPLGKVVFSKADREENRENGRPKQNFNKTEQHSNSDKQ